MSDERLRDLERAWERTHSVPDGARLLSERVRAGVLSPEALEFAAYVGIPAATAALAGSPSRTKRPPIVEGSQGTDALSWYAGLLAWGREPLVACLASALRCLLPEWERYAVEALRAPRTVLDSVLAWARCPCEQHVATVVAAARAADEDRDEFIEYAFGPSTIADVARLASSVGPIIDPAQDPVAATQVGVRIAIVLLGLEPGRKTLLQACRAWAAVKIEPTTEAPTDGATPLERVTREIWLRDLERRRRESPLDRECQENLVRARLLAKDPGGRERAELSAFLGSPAALVLGVDARRWIRVDEARALGATVPHQRGNDLHEWAITLGTFGGAVGARALIALGTPHIETWSGAHPDLLGPMEAMQATESWIQCPCDQHASRAREAADHADRDALLGVERGSPGTVTAIAELMAHAARTPGSASIAESARHVLGGIQAADDIGWARDEIVDYVEGALRNWAMAREPILFRWEPSPD